MSEPRPETCDECGGVIEWTQPRRFEELTNPLDLGACTVCLKRFYRAV